MLRLLIATAGIAAVIATVQQLALRNRIDGPLPMIIGVCFAGAFVIATLKGNWDELAATCIILFPVALTAAFAPGATLYVLVGTIVVGGIGVIVEKLKPKPPKTKKTRST